MSVEPPPGSLPPAAGFNWQARRERLGPLGRERGEVDHRLRPALERDPARAHEPPVAHELEHLVRVVAHRLAQRR